MRAEPFSIHVRPEVLDDLKARLAETRWSRTDQQPESGAGPHPHDDVREIVAHWAHGYNWAEEEAALNGLPQFQAWIDGAHVHFVRMRGRGEQPMPLLLLHGWPDSFYRYHKVMARLADPESVGGDPRDAFDVVVPSLPGFGFTGRVPMPAGVQPTRHSARLMGRLMTEVLGYRQFAVAGGDGGSAMAQILAIDRPESVFGIHLTDLGWHAAGADAAALSKPEQKYLQHLKQQFLADGAYALVQSTRPQSLAAALNDSPAGLASWILDRFRAWSDCDGNLENSFTKDELLTNIMLYWITETIGPSMYNYFAEARAPSLSPADYVERPVGLSLFPRDIGGIPPRRLAERTLNVQRWSELPSGGHFAPLEVPDVYAREIVEFFRPLRASASGQKWVTPHVDFSRAHSTL